jgi:TDG/mug DNA glycosylase family protein
LDYDIGLTNIAPHRIGLDNVLRKSDFDVVGLRAKIEHYQPCVLAFNGKRGAQEFFGRVVAYGQHTEMIGETQVFVLPSTSGATRGFWDERWWWELAGLVKGK